MPSELLTNKKNYFLLEWETGKSKADFDEIFKDENPVTLEIGSGRGELIACLSEFYPGNNYLGVELSRKRIVTMLRRFDLQSNSNIRLIKAKVDPDFLKCFPENSFSQVIILHPDPWPKRRHHKNRLINESFIEQLFRVIKSEGEVLISTDYEEYAKSILQKFSSRSSLFRSVYDQGFRRESFWNDLETHFEAKMKKNGFTPFYMKYLKNTED